MLESLSLYDRSDHGGPRSGETIIRLRGLELILDLGSTLAKTSCLKSLHSLHLRTIINAQHFALRPLESLMIGCEAIRNLTVNFHQALVSQSMNG